LQERVKRRADELSSRFDSLTFDAFAKGLLDRFRICLPEDLRPPAEYRIVDWYKRDTEDFLRSLKPPKHLGTTDDLVALKANEFMKHMVLGRRSSTGPSWRQSRSIQTPPERPSRTRSRVSAV
jgi:hypothetical protein